MSDDLVKKALTLVREQKKGAEPKEDAMGDCLKEAWDAMEAKDFDSFKEAFKAAVKVATVEDDDD